MVHLYKCVLYIALYGNGIASKIALLLSQRIPSPRVFGGSAACDQGHDAIKSESFRSGVSHYSLLDFARSVI